MLRDKIRTQSSAVKRSDADPLCSDREAHAHVKYDFFSPFIEFI